MEVRRSVRQIIMFPKALIMAGAPEFRFDPAACKICRSRIGALTVSNRPGRVLGAYIKDKTESRDKIESHISIIYWLLNRHSA